MTTGKSDQNGEMEFLSGIRGAKWLFGEDLVDYLEKILWHKACDLWVLQEELQGMPPGSQRTEKVRAKAEIKKWLIAQLEVLDGKFAPYLRLQH